MPLFVSRKLGCIFECLIATWEQTLEISFITVHSFMLFLVLLERKGLVAESALERLILGVGHDVPPEAIF